MNGHICLIEDDPIMGESLVDRFSLEGFRVDWHLRGDVALPALQSEGYDAVISDVRLPGLSGEEVFSRARRQLEVTPPFFFITAFASVDRAVEMLKLGAADYVTKPFEIGELVKKVSDAVGLAALPTTAAGETPLGISESMRALAAIAPRVAARARSVLITGESGSGKEVLARYLHQVGGEARPFVAVNCAAIPETLIEDALFGHERGAFTGAERATRGCFEQASGGILFLDEIGDLPLTTQAKLLRAVQDRSIRRLGGEAQIDVNTQLICATNVDLKGRVEAGTFREDLFYRIAVVQLDVPPLRRRPEDILWLTERFLCDRAIANKETPRRLRPSAQVALLACEWPGNVRELQNRVERALVFSESETLTDQDLFPELPSREGADGAPMTLEAYLADAETAYLRAVLDAHGGRVTAAAAALGISRKTLWEKMRRHRLGVALPERDGETGVN